MLVLLLPVESRVGQGGVGGIWEANDFDGPVP